MLLVNFALALLGFHMVVHGITAVVNLSAVTLFTIKRIRNVDRLIKREMGAILTN